MSSKYGFEDKEAQEEVTREVLPKYLEEKEKKIGRPEKKKMENMPSENESEEKKEEAAFIAEVESASESKVEYKKIEKKKKGKSSSVVEVIAPLLSQAIDPKEAGPLMSEREKESVDAKIAEVMRAQMEKYKIQLGSKVEKKSEKEVSPVVVPVEVSGASTK